MTLKDTLMKIIKRDRAYQTLPAAAKVVEKTVTIWDFLRESPTYDAAQLDKTQMIVRNGFTELSIDDIVLYTDGAALVYGDGKELFLTKQECLTVKAWVKVAVV